MSHQNTTDKSTEIEAQMKSNREMAVALRANALSTQDPVPIFKLNVDCWDALFDCLSLIDLHSFGQTCKFFHRIAGKYFEWKYKQAKAYVRSNSMSIVDSSDNWNDLNGFYEFAQKLCFYDCAPDASFLYALENCKSPVHVEIVNTRSTELDITRLEKMLANVEILTLRNLYVPDQFMESFMELCAMNLKRLNISKSEGYSWMHHQYPALQHIFLYDLDFSVQLIKFFERNPNVRSFSTLAGNILKYRNDFMACPIQLDDLTVLYSTMDSDIQSISNALIDLHRQGFFKRLHFMTDTAQRLTDLPGLTTLHLGSHYAGSVVIKMPNLPTVTCIYFQPLWGSRHSGIDIDQLANALVNLECVRTHTAFNMECLMPFIRSSKRLKEIKMGYFCNKHGEIDPVIMNKEREKLKDAHKVTVYVQEKDYLMIKWKYNTTDFGLVEMRRNESYDGKWYNPQD